MSFDPSSLNFVVEHDILSSFALGSPLLKGGPFQMVNPSESLTKMSKDGGEFAPAMDNCESFGEI